MATRPAKPKASTEAGPALPSPEKFDEALRDESHAATTRTSRIARLLAELDPGQQMTIDGVLEALAGSTNDQWLAVAAIGLAHFITDGPGKRTARRSISEADDHTIARIMDTLIVSGIADPNRVPALSRTALATKVVSSDISKYQDMIADFVAGTEPSES
jgi:hypothetical protein